MHNTTSNPLYIYRNVIRERPIDSQGGLGFCLKQIFQPCFYSPKNILAWTMHEKNILKQKCLPSIHKKKIYALYTWYYYGSRTDIIFCILLTIYLFTLVFLSSPCCLDTYFRYLFVLYCLVLMVSLSWWRNGSYIWAALSIIKTIRPYLISAIHLHYSAILSYWCLFYYGYYFIALHH